MKNLTKANFERYPKTIFYVYRHIRLDADEVFYIGTGTKNFSRVSERATYKRAYNKSHRHPTWKDVVSITNYEVEIIFETTSKKECFDKEEEFIKLYGRKDLGLGTLVNVCNGGGGTKQRTISEKTKEKISKTKKEKNSKLDNFHSDKPVFLYRITGDFYKEFHNYKAAALHLGVDYTNITAYFKGRSKQCRGMVFRKSFKGEKIEISDLTPQVFRRKVLCSSINSDDILEFSCIRDAAKFFKVSNWKIKNSYERNTSLKDFRITITG